MPKTVAVLDACVLYPPSLRDLLMWLAASRVYAPRWTEEIHVEWIRNVLANNLDVTPAQLDRTRRLMNQVAPHCAISGYETHIPTLRLPDANDCHVLAAAIKANATAIVTFNLPDFPVSNWTRVMVGNWPKVRKMALTVCVSSDYDANGQKLGAGGQGAIGPAQ